MKKSLFITLLLSSVFLMADDLIVDKNSRSQYQTDNYYLQFDPFKYDLHFEGGSETREKKDLFKRSFICTNRSLIYIIAV